MKWQVARCTGLSGGVTDLVISSCHSALHFISFGRYAGRVRCGGLPKVIPDGDSKMTFILHGQITTFQVPQPPSRVSVWSYAASLANS